MWVEIFRGWFEDHEDGTRTLEWDMDDVEIPDNTPDEMKQVEIEKSVRGLYSDDEERLDGLACVGEFVDFNKYEDWIRINKRRTDHAEGLRGEGMHRGQCGQTKKG